MARKAAFRDELIGATVKIIEATNKHDIGINGKVIDETQNTITILAKNGRKRLFKHNIVLGLGESIIHGASLKGRHHERIKK